MTCHFQGAFSSDEKRRIRSSLQKRSKTAAAIGISDNERWRVRKHSAGDGPATIIVQHEEFPVEMWGYSVDVLTRQIEDTATLIGRSGRAGQADG